MKLTLGQIISPTFTEAFLALTSQPLPAVAAYRLGKVLKQLQDESKEFDAARASAMKAHTSEDEVGADGETLPGKIDRDACVKDLEALLAKEVEINLPERIALTDKIHLSAQQVLILDEFFAPPA